MARTPKPGLLVTAMVALMIAVVAVACGSDDEAEPTAAPTQEPAAAQATPIPTPLVESAGSLEDLFISDATTGRDVIARISEDERDCLRGAIGSELYQAMLDIPMQRLVGEVGSSGAGSFLGCLTDDNVVLMGLVLVDSYHGRNDPEARACAIAVGRANPEVIRVRFELLRPALEDTDTAALFASTKELFDCLDVTEQVNVLVRLTTRLDAEDSFTGEDVVAMLPEEEVSCIRDRVGEELFQTFLGATVTEAFAPAAVSLLDCLTLGSKTALFAAFTASRVEGLRQEAVVCMATLVADSPHVLALGFGTLDVDQLEESDLARLGDEAARLFDCLNSEEVYQVLTLPAVVEQ